MIKQKNPEQQVAIKQITKKQLAKSQSLLEKEIKILKVNQFSLIIFDYIQNIGVNKTST